MDRKKKRLTNSTATMNIDWILHQLASMADNSKSFITGKSEDEESDATWKADLKACENATAILSALQDEGIGDPEQLRDMIMDYNLLAEQHRHMWEKYETPSEVVRIFGAPFCPECKKRIWDKKQPNHCGECGQRLNWSQKRRKRK